MGQAETGKCDACTGAIVKVGPASVPTRLFDAGFSPFPSAIPARFGSARVLDKAKRSPEGLRQDITLSGKVT